MKYSVLLSLYKKESPVFLEEALHSLFRQTVLPAEVVVVYDGVLTPELYGKMEALVQQYPVIKTLPLEQNRGLGLALQYGLAQCRYPIVARMDTDDICIPERFEKQLRYLEQHPDVTLVGGAIEEFDTIPGDMNRRRSLPESPEEVRKWSGKRNPLNHQTVMFRKADVEIVGSYESVLYFEDYYLWLKLLHHGKKIANLGDVLVHARVSNDMIGKRHGFAYARKELKFLGTARKNGYISNLNYLKLVSTRFPLRIVPKKLLAVIYDRILR